MLRSFIITLCLLLTACNTTKTTDPDEDEGSRKIKTAKINAQLGIAYLESHNVRRAKQKLLMALDQAPSIPEPWYSMAYYYEATGDKVQAKKYYLRAIALAPERGDVHNNFGTYLCRSGQYKASLQHFELATKDPDYLSPADAFENAGLCAMKIPNKRLATKYFNRAIMHDPNRLTSLHKLAELQA